MKNALKIGLLAISIGVIATGCFGCGDGDRGGKLPKIDSDSTTHQKPIDTTAKAGIDTTKKDTTKK